MTENFARAGRLDAAARAHARGALRIDVPDEFVEEIVEVVLERLSECAAPASPYLNVEEAAEYLRCWTTKDGEVVPDKQRIYDLLSSGRLTRYKDGARVLVLRSDLDELVAPALPASSRSRTVTRVAR